MSCQFHPTISDTKPASPTAVLLHLYYLHDPRLGLPRPHHSLPPELAASLLPPFGDDDDGSELTDGEYDDEELWCAGPGLYVAYECVRVWIEADTAVRELCEHLEDIVGWPIDDMGVQVWHGDSKLHPTHTFSQLAWYRQLLPATTASPPSSTYDRLLLCLPADPCVCAHCCRIDFARAKRRVKLVRRHIEQHYTEMVMPDDEAEEEEAARQRDGRVTSGGKSKRGEAVQEDDSWMDEVDTAGKAGKDKGGGGGVSSKIQSGKAAGGGNKPAKKKQSREAQRLAKKEKEAKEEREKRVREQREKDEAARQERAKRDAEILAEQERAERDRDELRQLREENERQRQEARDNEQWQKEWVEETKVGQPTAPVQVTVAPAQKRQHQPQQQASRPHIDRQSTQPATAITATGLNRQQQQQSHGKQSKAAANIVNTISPIHKPTQPHKQTAATTGERQQHTTVSPVTQPHSAALHDTSPHTAPHHQPQHTAPRWKPAADGSFAQHPTSPSSRIIPSSATPSAAAVSHTASAVTQAPRWKGWGSPSPTRACPPPACVQSLPLSPHSTYVGHSQWSPYPPFSTASTDDDNSSLNSDSFSLFSSASALLPPSSPISFRSHRLSSSSSSNSASTVTSPCLSSLSGQSLSPSLPPLFCDKSTDAPLPAVLSPFTASRVACSTVSSRASAVWPLSLPQHVSDGELRQQDDDDEDAVLQAACNEYAYYTDDQQQLHPADEQQWADRTTGWHNNTTRLSDWELGNAAPGTAVFTKHDGSLYNTQYRPYREGLLVGHAGPVGAPVSSAGVRQSGPQLYGYMPMVQYVPVYISNEQAQSR